VTDKYPPLISGQQLELLAKAVEIEQADAKAVGMVGYQARLWAQLSLPYRNPGKDLLYWERRNGDLSLTLRPGLVRAADGSQEPIYPFGVVPRLLLIWMATEAVRLGEPELSLGPNLASFLKGIGLPHRGGATVNRLRSQVQSLAKCSLIVEDVRPTSLVGESFQFVDSWQLWWTPRDGDDEVLWPSTITLSEKYFRSIQESSVPIDLRALAALRTHGGGGLPIDMYTWLAHRMSYLRCSTLVPWAGLAAQFGSQYKVERQFKAELLKAMPKVLAVYPQAKVKPTAHGLLLSPSPTPVGRR